MTTTIGALLILAGLGCFVAFNLLGTTVDAQGFLHEPFALLPLGYLLLFTGPRQRGRKPALMRQGTQR